VVLPERVKTSLLKTRGFQEIEQLLYPSRMPGHGNPYFMLAFRYLAPLLAIFAIVQWRRFQRQKIDAAFYIARDAWVMLEVYHLLARLLPGNCPRRYIRLSRRSVVLAHPHDPFQNVRPIAGKTGRVKVADWLGNFAVTEALRDAVLKTAGLESNAIFSVNVVEKLRASCETHRKEIQRYRATLRELIKDYLFASSVSNPVKRIGIIDCGWACTIQDTLRGVLGEADLVSGMYLGVSRQGLHPSPDNRKYGLLRDDFRKPRHQNPLEASAGVIRVWDRLLREPAETVVRLVRRKNGGVYAEPARTRTVGPVERAAAGSVAAGLREGIRARLERIKLLIDISCQFEDEDFEMAAANYARSITTHPSLRTAKAIMRLGLDEGTARNRSSGLGPGGIKGGTAWYPGMLALSGFGWTSPLLESVARPLLKAKIGAAGDKNFGFPK
jgi:hypothetical protein